jgi:DNA topoisomerase-1
MASPTINLVIVESPTKARKLRDYLGSDFVIEASVGHVRDLPKSKLGIEIEKDFEPTYEMVPGKSKVVSLLRKEAASAAKVYLAMDPDREGEAIAWHVKHLLSEKLKSKAPEFLRAVFHQITKDAVLSAIEHPGEISHDLVDAQQARRVVDRLVGYKLSPVLWKKVRRGLSEGRVLSQRHKKTSHQWLSYSSELTTP